MSEPPADESISEPVAASSMSPDETSALSEAARSAAFYTRLKAGTSPTGDPTTVWANVRKEWPALDGRSDDELTEAFLKLVAEQPGVKPIKVERDLSAAGQGAVPLIALVVIAVAGSSLSSGVCAPDSTSAACVEQRARSQGEVMQTPLSKLLNGVNSYSKEYIEENYSR